MLPKNNGSSGQTQMAGGAFFFGRCPFQGETLCLIFDETLRQLPARRSGPFDLQPQSNDKKALTNRSRTAPAVRQYSSIGL